MLAPAATDEAGLRAAFASFKGLSPAAVGAITAGSLHLAHVSSTVGDVGTARFAPSTQAPPQAVVGFQDGGNIGVFIRRSGGSWQMTKVGGEPFPCPGLFSPAVQALWALPNSLYCRGG